MHRVLQGCITSGAGGVGDDGLTEEIHLEVELVLEEQPVEHLRLNGDSGHPNKMGVYDVIVLAGEEMVGVLGGQ